LDEQTGDHIDLPIWLGGTQHLPVRLLATRVPQEVVDQRRRRLRATARAKGQTVSATVLALAAWTIFVTNCPAELMSLAEALVLGRMRWQIALIFKLWKSHGTIDELPEVKPWRQRCTFYAKILGMIITHWMMLTSCWQMPDRSLTKAAQAIRVRISIIATATGSVAELTSALTKLVTILRAGCRMNSRKRHPNAYQLLLMAGGEVLA